MNPEQKPPIPPPEASPSPLKQIRTFQGDIAEALKERQTSVYSLEQQEKAKHQARANLAPEPAKTSSSARKVILLLVGTLVFVGLGGGGTWYAYNQYKQKTALPTVSIPANQFIGVENSVEVDTSNLSRDTLIGVVRDEKAKSSSAGAVEQIELKNGVGVSAPLLGTEDFLNLLQASTPGNLVRALDPLFMLGILTDPGSAGALGQTHTFILIKLDSFENAFPGMLNWEPTLSNDLLPLFASDAEVQNVSATSTFSDITIQNKDARILEDNDAHTVLLYSFYGQNYLIITDNEDSLRAIITLLDSRQLSQ